MSSLYHRSGLETEADLCEHRAREAFSHALVVHPLLVGRHLLSGSLHDEGLAPPGGVLGEELRRLGDVTFLLDLDV